MTTPDPPSAHPSPNFGFLAYHDPRLSVLGTQAERLFAEDPSACLGKLRLFGEILAQRTAAKLGLYTEPRETQAALVDRISARGAASSVVVQMFDGIRAAGNRAVHEGRGDHQDALHQLRMARELSIWFQRSFGNNQRFDPGPFVPPTQPAREDAALRVQLEALRRELAASKVDAEAARAAVEAEARRRMSKEQLAAQLEEERQVWEALAHEEAGRAREIAELQAKLSAELARIQAEAAAAPKVTEKLISVAAAASSAIELTEADTRHIIDRQLRDAGWEADSMRRRGGSAGHRGVDEREGAAEGARARAGRPTSDVARSEDHFESGPHVIEADELCAHHWTSSGWCGIRATGLGPPLLTSDFLLGEFVAESVVDPAGNYLLSSGAYVFLVSCRWSSTALTRRTALPRVCRAPSEKRAIQRAPH